MNQQTFKKENLWNQLLSQQNSNSQGFQNKNILILGRRFGGKRTLIDSLTDISKTTYPKRDPKDQLAGKMKQKGSAALLDYTYLNVLDLKDHENNTNARLNIHMIEEDISLINMVLNEKTVHNTFIVIALDLQEPWTFMDDLNKWIDGITKALENLASNKKLSLQQLEEMKRNIEYYVRNFKEDTQEVKQQIDEENTQSKIQIPLREGVLKTNIGLPIMVVVNKSDILEQAEKEKDWDSKFEVIRFCLRQFCISYGATLLLTSSRQNININIFYEYILHRLYGFPLKHKTEQNSSESIFIPAGFDDTSILKSIFNKLSGAGGNINYDEKVPIPPQKKTNKEEIIVEDNQEFFKKLKEKQGTVQPKAAFSLTSTIQQSEKTQEEKPSITSSLPSFLNQTSATPSNTQKQQQNQQLQNFYSKILKPEGAQIDKQQQAKENATNELFSKIRGPTAKK